MKNVFQHPPEPATGRKYWRGLDEFEDSPEFRQWLEREFPEGASELAVDGVSRRKFMQLMGASAALAGLALTGCRRPEKHLVPFTKNVEWTIPGKPLFYATSMPRRGGAVPLIVTTHDGRPTKVEGNPLHPASNGGSDTFAQASVLSLYDPERSRRFLWGGTEVEASSFETALDDLLAQLGQTGGDRLAFLLEENNSPTRERLRGEIERRFPGVKWCVYEPLGADGSAGAMRAAYGDGVRLAPRIENADVIVSIGADFLSAEAGNLQNARAFANGRRLTGPGGKMNRLYVVEHQYTTTGGMADHRLRMQAHRLRDVAFALATEIGAATGDGGAGRFSAGLQPGAALSEHDRKWVHECAADLVAAKGRALVLAGERLPAEVQLLVQSINSALGALGQTVIGQQVQERPGITLNELAEEIKNNRVGALVIIGGNPVYNAPADMDWAALQAAVPEVIRVGYYEDETSQGARWHAPLAHYLESWGDARSGDGAYCSVQPMILPLLGGWSELDVLARFAGQPKPEGPELVQETFRAIAGGGDFERGWNKFLHDGFLADSAPAERALFFNAAAASVYLQEQGGPAPVQDDVIEVVFAAGANMEDGRWANNTWLQELPDPVTKLTWDNAALMSPVTAKRLGVQGGGHKAADVIEITVGGRTVEAPVLIAPGHADNSLTLPLGYGRTVAGWVGAKRGFNAYALRTLGAPYVAAGAQVTRTGRKYRLAITQVHQNMEGRAIVREGTLEQYNQKPAFAKTMGMDGHIPPNISLYRTPPLDAIHQWAMTIDLTTCSGCNACMAACQAENNIPVVGKEQVIDGREMHWIRMDRYFAGPEHYNQDRGEYPSDPDMVMQPMLCQHCENAPCETVCPVNATVHNNEGLNVMAYNRCIGTRYCANNCPFKVRRFNFFDYNQRPVEDVKFGPFKPSGLHLGPLTAKGMAALLKMQKNPNVTVRMRGVMEKCTFCVQRIEEAKITQKVKAGASDNVLVPADSFKVACQQACPSESIVFGNKADPNSAVAKQLEQERGYRVLEYLNVLPRVTYLARIRNPNMKMPDAHRFSAGAEGHHAKAGAVEQGGLS